MIRRGDWESALSAFLAEVRHRPHAYGRHDCLVGLVAGAVLAQTGEDPGAPHRGKYRSEAGAFRYLREELGHRSFESLLDSLFEEKPLGFALRGDVLLVADDAGQEVPGICLGDYGVIIATDGEAEGLMRVPRARWRKAWAVA